MLSARQLILAGMFSWLALPRQKDSSDVDIQAWFPCIANHLLRRTRLIVDGHSHRLVEIEFYYCAPAHPDPFTHRDPIQLECGCWYFHRTRGVYRSGSFKGLDLSFGDGKAFAGILIRSIEAPDGTLIDGPSLCVDYLLARTGTSNVNELDRAIARRPAWDPTNRLVLEERDEAFPLFLLQTARVGLSLKKARPPAPEQTRFIMRPYRYLSEPRRVRKGKPHMVLALHLQGKDTAEIEELTGCGKSHIRRYVEDFEAGREADDFKPYFGIDLGTKELCRLHGTWHRNYGIAVSLE